ncbi:MAG: YlbL family protein [Actinomycetota bacterium]
MLEDEQVVATPESASSAGPGGVGAQFGEQLGAPPPSARRRWRRWHTVVAVVAVVIASVTVAGTVIRLPYYTISPGEAVNLYPRVEVEGTKSYQPEGAMLLLFVRQRARVSVFRYVQASFDPDIDLFREEEFSGGRTPQEIDIASDAEMARSQLAAKKVALEASGFDVTIGDGVIVLVTIPNMPASGVLAAGDKVLAVNRVTIEGDADLGELVRGHAPGDVLTITIERDGETRDVRVGVEAADDGTPVIGVYVAQNYEFPVEVQLDTSSIGGPSAGLAMTLSIIDTLTPGALTGGQRIAVTGTIDDDGNVGEIGGISQKAVAARRAGADIFIVPACAEGPGQNICAEELERAIDRAGDMPLVPVATLEDALTALTDNGGEPVDQAA